MVLFFLYNTILMAENTYLIEFISNLPENEVDFIICGGVAEVFHGVERGAIS